MNGYYVHTREKLWQLDGLKVSNHGVVHKRTVASINDTAKTLIVGIGGMGLRTVQRLKRELICRVGAVRESDIQFLVIDADQTDLHHALDEGTLANREIVCLFKPQLSDLLQSLEWEWPDAFKNPLPPVSTGYMPYGYPMCGSPRQNRLDGRLSILLDDNYEDVVNHIRDALARLGDIQNQLNIYVVSGVGGGTGSGLCVDIPYILRHVTGQMGISPANVRLFGNIYLPDVYASWEFAGVALPRLYRNGYAALKEIDYYMNIRNVHEAFEAIYPDGPYSDSAPIFDSCTLIGGCSAVDLVIADTMERAISTCVRFLAENVTCDDPFGNGIQQGQPISMADILTNSTFHYTAAVYLSGVIQSGQSRFHESGNYHYNYIGSASLTFPAHSISEYYVENAFSKTIDQFKQNATSVQQTDVDAFEKGVAEPEELIRSSVELYHQQTANMQVNFDWNKHSIYDGAPKKAVDNIVQAVYQQFCNSNNRISQAQAKIEERAGQIFEDVTKGPFYLARLLMANEVELEGYYRKLDEYWRVCTQRYDLLKRAGYENRNRLEELVAKMMRFGQFRRNLEEYQNLLFELGRNELELRLCEKLLEDYYLSIHRQVGINYQLTKTLERYLSFADILAYTGEILQDNANAARNEIFTDDDPNSIFSLTDEALEPLKNYVRQELNQTLQVFEETQISSFAGALLKNITENPSDWVLDGENLRSEASAARAVRSFVSHYQPFAELTEKNLPDYLDAAYQNASDAQKDRVAHCIANRLRFDSTPQCNAFDDFEWRSVDSLKYQYMVLPHALSQEWTARAVNQANLPQNAVYLGSDPNCMSQHILYVNLPIWIHSWIEKYEQAYYSINEPGIHINESKQMDPPYKVYPPLFPPQQWFRARQGALEYSNPAELEYQNELTQLIQKALEIGVICREGELYQVKLLQNHPSQEELNAFLKEYVNNRDNYTSDLQLQTGGHLYTALLNQWGAVNEEICSVRQVLANREENLPQLIRRQMKLIGKLQNEVAHFHHAETIITSIRS